MAVKKYCIWAILASIIALIPIFLILLSILISKLVDLWSIIGEVFIYIFYLSSPFAILSGKIALEKIKDNPKLKGKKLARAAITTGLVYFILILIASCNLNTF